MGKPYFRERDGMWVVQFELPTRPDGTRRRKYVTAKKRGDVIQKARDAQQEIADAGDILTGTPTVAQWLDHWIDKIAAPNIKPRTLENYRHMLTLIKPPIGKVRLDRLTGAHVRRVAEYVQETRGLSASTARNAHAVLRKSINDARGEGVVRGDNPAEVVKAPRKSQHDIEYLSPDEALVLLRSVLANDRDVIRWSLALMLGMRQGECLGLRADHVDLDAGTIHVEWQLQALESPPNRSEKSVDLGDGYYLTEPKTSHGSRVLPMTPELAEMMRRYIPTLAPTDFVCGPGIVDPRADARAWARALRVAGLPAVRLHSARHTALTVLARLGVDDGVRQAIAGHASKQITNEVYTHRDLEDKKQAMHRLPRIAPPVA